MVQPIHSTHSTSALTLFHSSVTSSLTSWQFTFRNGFDPGITNCSIAGRNSHQNYATFLTHDTKASPLGISPCVFHSAALLFHTSLKSDLFCAGGVTSPPYTDCYPTAPRLLCGWSDGLEWSPGCAASDASGLLGYIPLWP